MRYEILHEIPGRIRIHCCDYRFDPKNPIEVKSMLSPTSGLLSVTFSPRTGNLLVLYEQTVSREEILERLDAMRLFRGRREITFTPGGVDTRSSNVFRDEVDNVILRRRLSVSSPDRRERDKGSATRGEATWAWKIVAQMLPRILPNPLRSILDWLRMAGRIMASGELADGRRSTSFYRGVAKFIWFVAGKLSPHTHFAQVLVNALRMGVAGLAAIPNERVRLLAAQANRPGVLLAS